MKINILIITVTFALASCGGDSNSGETSPAKTSPAKTSPAKTKGNTIAEMTKNGQNHTTRQAKDAKFIHHITNLRKNMAHCMIDGSFTNGGKLPLFDVGVRYLVKHDAPVPGAAGFRGKTETTWRGDISAADWAKDPIIEPGETRPISIKVSGYSCEMLKSIELKAFRCRGVNADGTPNPRNVQCGAPALIIDNQTSLPVIRGE